MSDHHDDTPTHDAQERDGRLIGDLVDAMFADRAQTDDRGSPGPDTPLPS